MYVRYLAFLFLILFSCNGEKEKKELSGPHAEILLMASHETSLDEKGRYKTIEMYGNEEAGEVNKRYIALFQTEALLRAVSAEAGLKHDPSKIRDLLKFSSIAESGMLKIEFYHNNENEAKKFLKILVNRMEESLMEEERKIELKKINKLEEMLDSLKLKMEEAEMDIEDRNILNLDDYSDPYGAESQAYFEAFVKVSQQKRNLLELQKIMNDGADEKLAAYISAFGNEDEFLKKALSDKYKMQIQLEQIQCPTATNVECKTIRKKMDLLDEDILIYVKNSITALEQKENELESLIKKMPKKAEDINQSKKEHLVNVKLYEYLIEQRATLQIGMAGIIGPKWVIK